MIVVTLDEKIVVVSGGETFYGKVLVGDSMKRVGDDTYQLSATGFISIVRNVVSYNTFRNGKTEFVNFDTMNVAGVQPEANLTGVPTA